jgi:predicted ATPase
LKIHLREMRLNDTGEIPDAYPFSIPLVKSFERLSFEKPITIFIGENGSGKSTLLEALAKAAGMITVGSAEIDSDETLNPVQPLANVLRLVWNKKTHRGFFLRAEDFFGYIKRLRALRESMQDDLTRIDTEYEGRSAFAKSLASLPAASSIHSMDSRYGTDLDANSHGESFLTLFQSRFVPDGLFMLDEPEAALSPLSQLGLIAMIKDMVEKGGQFILATHSPILMALPDADLLDFDFSPPKRVGYDELSHVVLYRSFLEDPKAYLRRL